MTQMLEQALERVRHLAPGEQDAIAALILEELEDERRWTAAFQASSSQLAALGREALADFKAGRTRLLDVSES